MKRPVIGISCARDERAAPFVRTEYAESVLVAGGMPVLLPQLADEYVDDQLAVLDGIVFSGGPDYHPELYGQELHPLTNVMNEQRQQHDLLLFAGARRHKLPILAICAGVQLAAIHFGASLIQDIDEHHEKCLVHHVKDFQKLAHAITIDDTSVLYQCFQSSTAQVNSMHHQSVAPDSLPNGLRMTAWSEDGVLEAIETVEKSSLDNGAWFLGVQFHPEHLVVNKSHLAIFEQLVSKAQRDQFESAC